jgi:hypothetical protein
VHRFHVCVCERERERERVTSALPPSPPQLQAESAADFAIEEVTSKRPANVATNKSMSSYQAAAGHSLPDGLAACLYLDEPQAYTSNSQWLSYHRLTLRAFRCPKLNG